MIGKVMIGKSFGGCIAYCLEDKKMKGNEQEPLMHNRATVLKMNNCFGNKEQLIKQFKEVKYLNPKLSKPVIHITLGLAPGEFLEEGQLIEIAEHCAEQFGFTDNQYLAVEHRDTDHQHIHIVANRIGFSGKTNVNDSNCYKKVANFCRRMEKKYDLQKVLSPKKFLPKELRELPRHDTRKLQMKEILSSILSLSKSLDEFINAAQNNKIKVIKSRGISFIDGRGVKVKGSEINLSLQTIENQIMRNNRMQVETEFVDLGHRKWQMKL
ncbi:MAG: relaxase/mobilization nuclease domain-containing protein [Chitinophagaceae bacterium]|nr:relaxase/mobilization nuclease domain-containing protein [Chitinophagaceae bacterium]